MKHLKTFEAQVKEDGHHKYKVGDIVKYRETKKNINWISKLAYEILELKSGYAHIFTHGHREVRKNEYRIKSVDEPFDYIERERNIKLMTKKEIEQYKLEHEISKFNL